MVFTSVRRSPLAPAAFTSALCALLLASAGCGEGIAQQPELPPVEDLARVGQASVDCTPWTDTGYVNGAPFDITLVTVDGEPAEVSTANAYVVMQSAAAADGVGVVVVSGFRTYAEQEYLYTCYVNCNCNNCNLAAQPGYSNHQSGHALDLNASSGGVLGWLNAHGADYGFSRTVASEDWHWEWWGGGPGGGPCNDTTPPTPCTVDTTGKTGECMDMSACAALGDHESTAGYCPGPSNIQCCTATTTSAPDAAVDDAAPLPDAGGAGGSAGAAGNGGAAGAAGTGGVEDGGIDAAGWADASDGAAGQPSYGAVADIAEAGPCSFVAGRRANGWGWLVVAGGMGVSIVVRRRRG